MSKEENEWLQIKDFLDRTIIFRFGKKKISEREAKLLNQYEQQVKDYASQEKEAKTVVRGNVFHYDKEGLL